MRLLLDTHVLLVLIGASTLSLPPGIKTMLDDPGNEHHLSVASLWEIAIKTRVGKLSLSFDLALLPELIEGIGITLLSIDAQHALTPVDPQPRTRDPFDNMLLAQCRVEGLRLLTMDRALVAHPLAAKSSASK